MNKNNCDEKLYNLKTRDVIGLIIYYTLMIIAGLFSVVFIFLRFDSISQNLLPYALWISLTTSAMFSSLKYIYVIYKAAIYERVSDCDNKNSRIGNLVYFIYRPVYALVFDVLFIAIYISGLYLVTNDMQVILNERFFFICILAAALIGFSTGKVLERFNLFSSEKIDSYFESIKKEK